MSAIPPTVVDLVIHRITCRTGRRVRNLAVEIGSGLVTLRGRVNSYHIKQLALTGAREALPDAQLDNAIVVE